MCGAFVFTFRLGNFAQNFTTEFLKLQGNTFCGNGIYGNACRRRRCRELLDNNELLRVVSSVISNCCFSVIVVPFMETSSTNYPVHSRDTFHETRCRNSRNEKLN